MAMHSVKENTRQKKIISLIQNIADTFLLKKREMHQLAELSSQLKVYQTKPYSKMLELMK